MFLWVILPEYFTRMATHGFKNFIAVRIDPHDEWEPVELEHPDSLGHAKIFE